MVVDEYYKKYLDEKLSLVFNDNGQTVRNNLCIKTIGSDRKSKKIEKPKYLPAVSIALEEAKEKFPYEDYSKVSTIRPQAYKLPNGIIGLKMDNSNNSWYFPELNYTCTGYPASFRQFHNGYFSLGQSLFNSNKQEIFCSRFDKNVEYEPYNEEYFFMGSKYGTGSSNKLIDKNGREFRYKDSDYLNAIIRKQCVLLKTGTGFYGGKTEDRYKVLLKTGALLHDGRTFSVVDEHDGMLLLSHKVASPRYWGQKSYGEVCVVLENGKVLDAGNEYTSVSRLDENLIMATKNSRHKLFNNDGKSILDISFINVTPYIKSYGSYSYIKALGTDHREYIFDEEGKIFSGRPYHEIEMIDEDYAKVKDGEEYKIIDKDGNVIHNNKKRPYGKITKFNNCFIIGDRDILFIPEPILEKAQLKKPAIGPYSYNNGQKTIHTRHRPVMLYGEDQALLLSNQKEYYIFNSKNNTCDKLGYLTTVHFNNTFVEVNGKVYYPYKSKFLDITDYYMEHLKKSHTITLHEDVGDIQTKEEYEKEHKADLALLQLQADIKNEISEREKAEAQKRMQEQRRKEEAEKKALLEKQAEERRTREAMAEREREEKRVNELRDTYLGALAEALDNLEALHVPFPKRPAPNDLLEWQKDHYEINPDYVDFLRVFDLSKIDFNNVKVSGGINFKGSNVTIDPQQVYNKNMSGSDFTGIYFSPFADFTMVNISGSKFSFDDDETTIDVFNSSVKNAIYDDNTKINDKPVEEYFKIEAINANRSRK